MIDNNEVVPIGYSLDGSFSEFLKAARFPLNSNVEVLFRKTL
jgi:hypothetical protein